MPSDTVAGPARRMPASTRARLPLVAGKPALRLDRSPIEILHEPILLVHPKALLPGVVTSFGVVGFNGFLVFASLYGREIGVGEDRAALHRGLGHDRRRTSGGHW